MQSKATVRERLVSLIHEIVGIPKADIIDGATIDDRLQMQSIKFVELYVAIEDEYGIEADPIQIVELNEFGAIVDYIWERIAEAAA